MDNKNEWLEDKLSINNVDNMEYEHLKVEKMRYQANKFSYYIGLLALISTAIYVFVILNCYDNESGKPIIKLGPLVAGQILFNILMFLTSFLGMEKTKAYDKKFSIVFIVMGVICFARIFILPLWLKTNDYISAGKYVLLMAFLIIASGLYLLAGAVGYIKSVILSSYLKSINEKK